MSSRPPVCSVVAGPGTNPFPPRTIRATLAWAGSRNSKISTPCSRDPGGIWACSRSACSASSGAASTSRSSGSAGALTFSAAGQPGLDEAIEVLKAATPSAGPTTAAVAAERAYALGVALATRFGRGGDADDAREELKAFREAVALSAADAQGAEARYRDGLGSAYFDPWRPP